MLPEVSPREEYGDGRGGSADGPTEAEPEIPAAWARRRALVKIEQTGCGGEGLHLPLRRKADRIAGGKVKLGSQLRSDALGEARRRAGWLNLAQLGFEFRLVHIRDRVV